MAAEQKGPENPETNQIHSEISKQKMDELLLLTNELRDKLTSEKNEKVQDVIFKHIGEAEKIKFTFPEFPSELDWFNVKKPLKGFMLQGKIVVLDFFTYCCINCLHVIPYLRNLEQKFTVEDGLVVIGIHSAKFDNEKKSENVLQALKRHNITHPVVNDKDSFLWNKLHISCWPTILVLGPNKQIIFVLLGEGHKNELAKYVKCALNYYKEAISSRELPLTSSHLIVSSSLLNFPNKIARCKNLFAVSDSGYHRILVFEKSGRIKFKIGGKTAGFTDGNFKEAKFNSPQGLTFYDSTTLYIADTENHAIRLANLETLTVTTVVGNGHQGTDFVGGKSGTLQEISSPWDVCIVPCSDVELLASASLDPETPKRSVSSNSSGSCQQQQQPPPPPPPPPPSAPFASSNKSSLFSLRCPQPPKIPIGLDSSSSRFGSNTSVNNCTSKVLLIATAGTHQIWAYFLDSAVWWKGKKYGGNVCLAVAGSGKEENRNNCFPILAAFAQPSGLAYSPEFKSVFIADSESSSIRRLSLTDGRVSHVAGGAKSPDDLFCFGDVDGRGYEARLQHPMGVAWNSKQLKLFVCDTYNNKVKQIEVTEGNCVSVDSNSPNSFSEPSGCCVSECGNYLYVCDTNNSGIKSINLTTNAVEKMVLREDLTEEESPMELLPLADTMRGETVLSRSGGNLKLQIEFYPFEIHGKWKLNPKNSKLKTDSTRGNLTTNSLELDLNFPGVAEGGEEEESFQVSFDLVLCNSETCDFKKAVLNVTVRRKATGATSAICRVTKDLRML